MEIIATPKRKFHLSENEEEMFEKGDEKFMALRRNGCSARSSAV